MNWNSASVVFNIVNEWVATKVNCPYFLSGTNVS